MTMYLLDAGFRSLNLSDQKIEDILHGSCTISQTARSGVEDIDIVLWVIDVGIFENMQMN